MARLLLDHLLVLSLQLSELLQKCVPKNYRPLVLTYFCKIIRGSSLEKIFCIRSRIRRQVKSFTVVTVNQVDLKFVYIYGTILVRVKFVMIACMLHLFTDLEITPSPSEDSAFAAV